MPTPDWAALAEAERMIIAEMDKIFELNSKLGPNGEKSPVVVAREVANLRLAVFAKAGDLD